MNWLMKSALRLAAAAALAATVAGCQMRGSVPLEVGASLESAGFAPVTETTVAPANMVVDGLYACPKARCGDIVVLVMGTLSQSGSLNATLGAAYGGKTLEQLLAGDGALRKAIAAASTQLVRAALAGQNVRTSAITMDARGVMRGSMSKASASGTMHARYIIVFKGNTMRLLLSASGADRLAARYARREWLR